MAQNINYKSLQKEIKEYIITNAILADTEYLDCNEYNLRRIFKLMGLTVLNCFDISDKRTDTDVVLLGSTEPMEFAPQYMNNTQENTPIKGRIYSHYSDTISNTIKNITNPINMKFTSNLLKSSLFLVFRGTVPNTFDVFIDIKLAITKCKLPTCFIKQPQDGSAFISRGNILHAARERIHDTLKYRKETYKNWAKDIRVHLGFQQSYMSVRDNIIKKLGYYLKSNENIKNIIITGHSLGGSLATLAAFDLGIMKSSRTGPLDEISYLLQSKNINIRGVSFGAPPVGNSNFAYKFDWLLKYNHIQSFIRVVNDHDIVVSTPRLRTWGFHHSFSYDEKINGTEIFKKVTLPIRNLEDKYILHMFKNIDEFNKRKKRFKHYWKHGQRKLRDHRMISYAYKLFKFYEDENTDDTDDAMGKMKHYLEFSKYKETPL